MELRELLEARLGGEAACEDLGFGFGLAARRPAEVRIVVAHKKNPPLLSGGEDSFRVISSERLQMLKKADFGGTGRNRVTARDRQRFLLTVILRRSKIRLYCDAVSGN
jgi:hypothetical protein